MHTWTWQTSGDRPFLTCSLLADFPHGFFTRHWSPQTPAELTTALHPAAIAYRLRQVHGNIVLTPAEIHQWHSGTPDATVPNATLPNATVPDGDGVATEEASQGAWVCSADCVPALIADTQTGRVAAVHAGWRGTAAQIVPRAIARLEQQGSQRAHLRVALGPAIAGSVYQVTQAVAAEVGVTLLPSLAPLPALTPSDPQPMPLSQRSPESIEGVMAALHQLPDSPLVPDPQPGRVRLDVRQVNRLQLLQLGLEPEQVAIAPYCTYQTPEHFFSYRRNPEKKVQWSGIVSLGA